MSSKKRGQLSTTEMNYIRQNCYDLSVSEIARNINRHDYPVRRLIQKENLRAKGVSDEEHLLSTLNTRYYVKELKKQMNESEMRFFEHQWVDFFKQFNEDVTHTEEMQIVEVVRTEILINRSMEDRQQIIKQSVTIEKLIDEEMAKPVEVRDTILLASLQTQLGSLIGSKSSYINEHEKLLSKKERYLKDLKGTREQRKRIADDAKTNFVLWLRQLEDVETREKEGFDMEVQSRAADKERARLAELHEYGDDEVDQPLLNTSTVINEDA